MKLINKLLIIGIIATSLASCTEDYLSVKGTSSMTKEEYREKVKENPDILGSTLAGTYAYLATEVDEHDTFSLMAILHSTDMMTEDIVQNKVHWFTYDYTLDFRLQNYRRPYATWLNLYTPISQVNNDVLDVVDIEAIKANPNSPIRKYIGQAYAIRAYCYMYLIQIFQNPFTGEPDINGAKINRDLPGVPMMYASMETSKTTNSSRNTVGAVLDMIKEDLETAITLLDGYNRSTKMNINKQVAQGLLARYYLMVGDWANAATMANAARQNYKMLSKTDLYSGFMDVNLSDWMWGFDHNSETSTVYASFFSHISNLSPGYAGLNYAARLIDKQLYEKIPTNDYRNKLFNGSQPDNNQTQPGAKLAYANLKFGWDGAWTQDYMYMRAAEMVLIEAEALARQNKLPEATTVMHELMDNRFDTWEPKEDVTVEDILLQRRIELWGEGFSYFDLKRLHRGMDRTYSGSNHRKPDGLLKVDAGDVRWTYQIPLREIQENEFISEEENNK